MNTVCLTGYIATDPDLLGKEENVLKFQLAVNEKLPRGNRKKVTHFVPCVMFSDGNQTRLLNIRPYLQKGQRIGIVGGLMVKKWKNSYGKYSTQFQIRIRLLEFLDQKGERVAVPENLNLHADPAKWLDDLPEFESVDEEGEGEIF